MKRKALAGAKIAVSLALLAYLLSTTDLAALAGRVRSADLLDLLGAIVCFALILALATCRWRLLLGAKTASRSRRIPVARCTLCWVVSRC